MVNVEVIFDPSVNQFFVWVVCEELNYGEKYPLTELIGEEFILYPERRTAMIEELERMVTGLKTEGTLEGTLEGST